MLASLFFKILSALLCTFSCYNSVLLFCTVHTKILILITSFKMLICKIPNSTQKYYRNNQPLPFLTLSIKNIINFFHTIPIKKGYRHHSIPFNLLSLQLQLFFHIFPYHHQPLITRFFRRFFHPVITLNLWLCSRWT